MKTLGRKKATLAIVAASVLWSTSGSVIQLSSLEPVSFAALRSLVAGIFFLSYLVFIERIPMRMKLTVPLLICSFAIALNSYLAVASTRATSSAQAVLLLYTAGVWVIALNSLLERRLPAARDLLCTVGVTLGLVLFLYDKLSSVVSSTSGITVGLITGFLHGLIIVLFRRMSIPDRFRTLSWGYLLAGIPAFYFGLPVSFGEYLGPLYLGLVVLGFAYVLYVKSVHVVSASQAALLPFLEPLLNPVWAYIFVGELLTFGSILGSGVVLFSLVLHYLLTERSLSK